MVYGYSSYISSHEFENFYPVDLYNYIKTGGKSLTSEETSELDAKDQNNEYETESEDEKLEISGLRSASGYGQHVRPSRCKLSAEEGGAVIIRIVRDIDD